MRRLSNPLFLLVATTALAAIVAACDGSSAETSVDRLVGGNAASASVADGSPPAGGGTASPQAPGGQVPGSEAGFGGSVATTTDGVPPREGDLPRSPAGLPMLPIEIKGERFLMELALDEPARRRGLGGRRSLEPDRGMLFAHPKPEILGYWMKDCLIDLDIVYVDAVGKVTALHRMKKEPPRSPGESLFDYQRRLPSYTSRRSAVLVLEFAPGTLDRLDLRMGEQLDLDVTKLRGMASE